MIKIRLRHPPDRPQLVRRHVRPVPDRVDRPSHSAASRKRYARTLEGGLDGIEIVRDR